MLYFGKPTGAAMPLMWAHAEYIKLLRSAADGQVFDLIPEVARALSAIGRGRAPLEVWKTQPPHRRGSARRAPAYPCAGPSRFIGALGEWTARIDTALDPDRDSASTSSISTSPGERAPIRFTFLWVQDNRWEGHDYAVEIKPRNV